MVGRSVGALVREMVSHISFIVGGTFPRTRQLPGIRDMLVVFPGMGWLVCPLETVTQADSCLIIVIIDTFEGENVAPKSSSGSALDCTLNIYWIAMKFRCSENIGSEYVDHLKYLWPI